MQQKPEDAGKVDSDIMFRLGRDELIIHRRYETLSIANDFLIAVWFLLGSILFLYPSMHGAAAWTFVAGSVQFIVRPTLRLARNLHIKRVPQGPNDM